MAMTPDSWFSSNRITVTVNLMLQKSKLEQRISQQNFTSLFHWFFSFTFDTSTTHLLITFTFCWITFLFYCSLITFAYLFSPVFLFSPVAFYTIYTRCTLWEKGKFDPQNSKKKKSNLESCERPLTLLIGTQSENFKAIASYFIYISSICFGK